MVENEVGQMMQEFEQRLQVQGMNLELYFQFSGQDEEALRAQMQVDAEQRVRTNLTLEEIAKAEELEAGDEEINEEIKKMAEMYNMPEEEIKKALAEI